MDKRAIRIGFPLNTRDTTVHEEKKPFKCDIWSAEYGHKRDEIKHVVIVHEGKNKFKCEITSKQGMKRHIAKIHKVKK